VFSVFNTQTVRHVLKTLAIFSVHLRQMHYVFREIITSAILHHFPSITCQHSSPSVNNWPVYLREEYLKYIKYTSFSVQNICNIFSYYQLIFCIRSKVIGIATTLRAGRSGHLVLDEKMSLSISKMSMSPMGTIQLP